MSRSFLMLSERIDRHLDSSTGEHWLWDSVTDARGYPRLMFAINYVEYNLMVTEVMYELATGALPARTKGQHSKVEQSCGVKLCSRPEHLRLKGSAVTVETNIEPEPEFVFVDDIDGYSRKMPLGLCPKHRTYYTGKVCLLCYNQTHKKQLVMV